MNDKAIMNEYMYERDKKIKERASRVEPSDYESNRDVINEIVLWKLNRSVEIKDATIDKIHKLKQSIHSPSDAIDSQEVKELILELLDAKGVKIAMASTILHFFYPAVFPIIDQRAYRELTGNEMPDFHTKDKNQRFAELYLHYIAKCCQYNAEIFPEAEFANIDKLLYQLDKNKNNKVRY